MMQKGLPPAITAWAGLLEEFIEELAVKPDQQIIDSNYCLTKPEDDEPNKTTMIRKFKPINGIASDNMRLSCQLAVRIILNTPKNNNKIEI